MGINCTNLNRYHFDRMIQHFNNGTEDKFGLLTTLTVVAALLPKIRHFKLIKFSQANRHFQFSVKTLKKSIFRI